MLIIHAAKQAKGNEPNCFGYPTGDYPNHNLFTQLIPETILFLTAKAWFFCLFRLDQSGPSLSLKNFTKNGMVIYPEREFGVGATRGVRAAWYDIFISAFS